MSEKTEGQFPVEIDPASERLWDETRDYSFERWFYSQQSRAEHKCQLGAVDIPKSDFPKEIFAVLAKEHAGSDEITLLDVDLGLFKAIVDDDENLSDREEWQFDAKFTAGGKTIALICDSEQSTIIIDHTDKEQVHLCYEEGLGRRLLTSILKTADEHGSYYDKLAHIANHKKVTVDDHGRLIDAISRLDGTLETDIITPALYIDDNQSLAIKRAKSTYIMDDGSRAIEESTILYSINEIYENPIITELCYSSRWGKNQSNSPLVLMCLHSMELGENNDLQETDVKIINQALQPEAFEIYCEDMLRLLNAAMTENPII